MRYQYYLVHETTPVRVTIDERGIRLHAEVPDAVTRRLVSKATFLSKIETSHEVEEIDRQTFERLCGVTS